MTAKQKRAVQLAAFADHVYAASEPDEEQIKLDRELAAELQKTIDKVSVLKACPICNRRSETKAGRCANCGHDKGDYEPEQAHGKYYDFREHKRFGGTKDDY